MNMKVWTAAGFVGIAVFLAPAKAQTVLKDHVSNAAAWADDVGGLLDHFLDPTDGLSGTLGIAIIGNGEKLSKVGVIFAHASQFGTPNQGDVHELRWKFRFFPDPNSFSISAMRSAPPEPNWAASFESPSNPDWTTVIGSFLGMFDLRYAEVDVSSLGITTTAGNTHLVVLLPESKLESPTTIASIAMSGGGAGTVGGEPDWYQRGADLGATGPGSLANLQENWTHGAVRVITTPSLSCAPPITAGADRLIICPGGSVHLSATPGSGGNTIDWFSGSCGGTAVGTGLSITVSPDVDTTYFARTRDTASGCTSDSCLAVGPIHLRSYALPDLDQDCDVDAQDLALMASCRSRMGVAHAATTLCAQADLDADGDVDQDDFAVLQRCYSGSGVSPACP